MTEAGQSGAPTDKPAGQEVSLHYEDSLRQTVLEAIKKTGVTIVSDQSSYNGRVIDKEKVAAATGFRWFWYTNFSAPTKPMFNWTTQVKGQGTQLGDLSTFLPAGVGRRGWPEVGD